MSKLFCRPVPSSRAACAAFVLATSLLPALRVAAASERDIVVGMSAPLSGPDASSSIQLRQGMELGIAHLNKTGGAGGRRVVLRALDDKGIPSQSLSNTRILLGEGAVVLAGYSGVASVNAAYPAMAQAGVPLIGVLNGAMDLRLPPRRFLFNVRASVNDEAAAIIHQLDALGANRVAILQQDDATGATLASGTTMELTRVGLRPVSVESVRPRAAAPAWNAALASLCAANPQAVVLAMSPDNAVLALKQSGGQECRMHFYATSETGAVLSAVAGRGQTIAGVVSAQVLPSPNGASMLAVAYRQDVAASPGLTASYAGLEGYLYARLIGETLQRCGRDPSSACVVSALESQRHDIQGFRVEFAPEERRGSRFVELTILDEDGNFRR